MLDMVQRSNDATLKDAQHKLNEEEFALGMEQYRQRNDAAAKGVQL